MRNHLSADRASSYNFLWEKATCDPKGYADGQNLELDYAAQVFPGTQVIIALVDFVQRVVLVISCLALTDRAYTY